MPPFPRGRSVVLRRPRNPRPLGVLRTHRKTQPREPSCVTRLTRVEQQQHVGDRTVRDSECQRDRRGTERGLTLARRGQADLLGVLPEGVLRAGGVDQDLHRLGYRRISRPMFPLDEDMADPDLSARLVPSSDQ